MKLLNCVHSLSYIFVFSTSDGLPGGNRQSENSKILSQRTRPLRSSGQNESVTFPAPLEFFFVKHVNFFSMLMLM